MIEQFPLWPDEDLPQSVAKPPEKNFKALNFPLWTQNKARLIQEYLRLFQQITHHGTYIDGFAAPQYSDHINHEEMWAAKLVLEMEPKWFLDFWLCDINPDGIQKLEALKAEFEVGKRRISVLGGDFNKNVHSILNSGRITEKKATFALLDQRTFECEWDTVVALSKHKKDRKIEQFYFFPTGWVDRSLAAISKPETLHQVRKWWGRDDWRDLLGMNGVERAKLVASRFEQELGYGRAYPYSIHNKVEGGRVMYHMIHATDHPDASPLMIRAYRKVSGRSELAPAAQIDFLDEWARLERDED